MDIQVKPSYLTCLMLVMLVSGFWSSVKAQSAERRFGVVERVRIQDQQGQVVGEYRRSYALLIGVSKYIGGWDVLPSVPEEMKNLEDALKGSFQVIKYLDLPSDQLYKAFEKFINDYGFDPNNRLLFFFSGHGHTRLNGEKGYLVPADAPDPQVDELGFLRRALPMDQILTWARKIEAKHALFLFDSCFSGTVFKYRKPPEKPVHITRLTVQPVRQFITAGDAGEAVPAHSVFTPAFIDAIEYGLADLDKDGYVTGTELGLYLRRKVPQHAEQSPQFGTITDYNLSRGDFVFELARRTEGGKPQASAPGVASPRPQEQPTPASTIKGPDGAEMVLIPAGEFWMGSEERAQEKPLYRTIHASHGA